VGFKNTLPTLFNLNGAGNKNTLPTLFNLNGAGFKNPLPTLFNLNGGQQKHVTHPTLIYWWALKTRYPPFLI